MWTIAWPLFLSIHVICGRLTGDHICQEEKRYTVNVTEYYMRNATTREYHWCMNVPPRCSFYTTKSVNDSRIVEKEISDITEKCCPGFSEDKDTCKPICSKCVHGTCKVGQCYCLPGFKGIFCDIECTHLQWGSNCELACKCLRGNCDPATGNCICPSGWNGKQCEWPCPEGLYGDDCGKNCDCKGCHHVTGQCPTTEAFPEKITTDSVIPVKNNGKFTIDKITVHTPTDSVMKFTEAKVDGKEVSDLDRLREENYINDEENAVSKNDMARAGAAVAIAIAVIVAAVAVVVGNRLRKNRKEEPKEGDDKAKTVPTVSVFTHSIFHTPLPDPPTFENPVFISPVDSNPVETQCFETRVVCSMNFPKTIKDSVEYLYDHPPSTGSYRVALKPEPPEMTTFRPLTPCEPLYDEIPPGVVPTPISEPPPSYASSTSPSSFYVNTNDKSRL